MKRGNLKSFADSKKIKYGTLNTIFITVVIAIVIVLNSIITTLGDAFGWYLDMTEEQLFTLSDPFVELLDNATVNSSIDIIFCCDKDEAEKNFADLSTGNVLSYVHSTATQIEDRLDNVSILYVDPIKEYNFMKKFNQASNTISPNEYTVIVARKDKNGEYGTMYRTLTAASFYTFNKAADGSREIYGYNGEQTFATAILSLAYEFTPSAYFVQGHGEPLPTELATLFVNCGFNVRTLYLDDTQFTCQTKNCGESWGKRELEDYEQDTFVCGRCGKKYELDKTVFDEKRVIPTDAVAVVVNKPSMDYSNSDIAMLSGYLTVDKGSLMCFIDPLGEKAEVAHPLKNLYDFFEFKAGVTVDDSNLIVDSSTTSNSEYNDFRGVISSNNAASTYLNAMKNYGTARPIFGNAASLSVDPKYSSAENGQFGYDDGTAVVYTLPLIDTTTDATFGDQRDKAHTVMTITAFQSKVDGQHDAYSYMLVSSGSFIDDSYLKSSMYPNEKILLSVVHSTTQKNVPINLDFKTFNDYTLDMTSRQSTTIFICLITILPLIVVGVGVIIMVRRKNR